jgi:hypothetical protein
VRNTDPVKGHTSLYNVCIRGHKIKCYNPVLCGGCSSVGRVQDCDSCCRGFEPHQPPHQNQAKSPALTGGAFCLVRPCRSHSWRCGSSRMLNTAKRNCMRVTECGGRCSTQAKNGVISSTLGMLTKKTRSSLVWQRPLAKASGAGSKQPACTGANLPLEHKPRWP